MGLQLVTLIFKRDVQQPGILLADTWNDFFFVVCAQLKSPRIRISHYPLAGKKTPAPTGCPVAQSADSFSMASPEVISVFIFPNLPIR